MFLQTGSSVRDRLRDLRPERHPAFRVGAQQDRGAVDRVDFDRPRTDESLEFCKVPAGPPKNLERVALPPLELGQDRFVFVAADRLPLLQLLGSGLSVAISCFLPGAPSSSVMSRAVFTPPSPITAER
jgi:hypothetical protein